MRHHSYKFLPAGIKPNERGASQTIVSHVEINKTNDLLSKLKLWIFLNYPLKN